jgi:CRP/FNR family cyclic AMP-dependent transcriptional regulator
MALPPRTSTAPSGGWRNTLGHHQNGALGTPVLRLERGVFDPAPLIDAHDGWMGLLVLEGVIVVELRAGRSRVAWLIGVEDLIRPWQLPQIAIATTRHWRALTQTRLAVLDHRFRLRAARTPSLTDELLARAADTTHWLLAQSLLLSSPTVEERLLLWFALCGERWGKVTPDGIVLDLPLTHDLLGALVGARRPTVSLALKSLQASGFLARRGSQAWLLSPERHWHAFAGASCATDGANALATHLPNRIGEAGPDPRWPAGAA